MFKRLLPLSILGWQALGLEAVGVALAAPMPRHAYEFQMGLGDSGTGDTPILAEGGVVASGLFSFDPMHPGDIYEGLTLKNPQLPDFGVYTIEMRLKLDRLRNETPPGTYGEDQGWIK